MKKTTTAFMALICLATQALSQGAYIEFKLSSAEPGVSGTSKVYCRDGNTRSEINMLSPQMPGGALDQVTLVLKDNPKKAYILNDKSKTYSEIDLSKTAATEDDPNQYEVTVIGKEKVNGYNATHVTIKKKTTEAVQDLWVSTEIPNYKQYMSVKSKYTTDGLFKALAAKGALGFLVRVRVNEHGRNMQVDLVKSEMRNNDASLFSLDGYKKNDPTASGGSGTPAELQEMAKKMQSMTPEERQQFIDQLRKQQQANPNPSAPTSYPH